jgi:hypothetical protein
MKTLFMFYIINVHHIFYCIQRELLARSIGKFMEKELSDLDKKQVCAFLLSHFVS